MRLILDTEFQHGQWPGPLHGREARVGELACGPARAAHLIAVACGVAIPERQPGERIARLVPLVQATPGFWSRSAEADAFATARRLLQWWDQLREAGWNGEAAQPRLQALAALGRQAPAGMADALHGIAVAAQGRDTGIVEVVLHQPREQWSEAWRRVFAALESGGTRVVHEPLADAPARGDLAAARGRDFAPAGDGSLLLLRPPGPMQAADEVAAWIAQLGDEALRDTVVIGGDALLDAALRRHGLPTLGTSYPYADGALLQLLPLALEMVWSPQDPQRAFELLLPRPSPVPGGLARELAIALRVWPAVDSDDWREAMTRELGGTDDATRRTRERMRLLWTPVAKREAGVPTAAVRERAEMLRDWLAPLAELAGEGPEQAALHQCRVFLMILEGSQLDTLSEPTLRRLLGEATNAAAGERAFPACAGLVGVDAPGAVAGPARHVVWWNFTGGGASVGMPPLSRAELADARANGAVPPDAVAFAVRQSEAWSRPLRQATESLLLVCPSSGIAGDEQHPHALWEEIAAGGRRLDRAEVRTLSGRVPVTRRSAAARPAPVRDWRIAPDALKPRERESPSSVEGFIGCSFQWAMRYGKSLRGVDSVFVSGAGDSRLLGSLLHHLLDGLFDAGVPPLDQVVARAEQWFDSESPRLAAPLWLPGAEATRARARRAFAETAHRLARLMHETGTHVVTSEQAYRTGAFGGEFSGTPDLVLGDPLRIVDLKWGGAGWRRDTLAQGTAFQLAAYAQLVGDERGVPPVAYLIMSSDRFFSNDAVAFPGTEVVAGPPLTTTWALLESAHAARWEQVREGTLEASGVEAEDVVLPKKHAIVDDRLVLKPPCDHCSYSTLCGRAFVEPEDEE